MGTQGRHLKRYRRPWRLGPRAPRQYKRGATSWVTVAIAAAGLVLMIAFVVVCVSSMTPRSITRTAPTLRSED